MRCSCIAVPHAARSAPRRSPGVDHLEPRGVVAFCSSDGLRSPPPGEVLPPPHGVLEVAVRLFGEPGPNLTWLNASSERAVSRPPLRRSASSTAFPDPDFLADPFRARSFTVSLKVTSAERVTVVLTNPCEPVGMGAFYAHAKIVRF